MYIYNLGHSLHSCDSHKGKYLQLYLENKFVKFRALISLLNTCTCTFIQFCYTFDFKHKQKSTLSYLQDFNPERYGSLCKLFQQNYMDNGDPSCILQQYLNVATKGSCQSNKEIYDLNEFPLKSAFLFASIKGNISINLTTRLATNQ